MADTNSWSGLILRWGAGLLLGVVVAFVPLAQVVVGLGAVIVAAIWVSLRRPRGVVLSGFLVGLGAIWAILLANAILSCSNGTPAEGCVGPDLTGWSAVPLALVLAGLALGLASILQRARPRTSHGPSAQGHR